MYQHNDGISLLDTELPDGLHKSSGWIDCPPDVTDDQGNCLVITYLRFAEGQYWGRRIYFPANDGNAIYVNNCSIGVWQGWERIPTDVPPQEFDLPLASGFTALSGGTKYCKTQENIVIVNIRCKANSSLTPSGNTITIGNLPSGFRPSGFVSAGAVFDTDDLGGKYAGGITVNQNGQVNANQQNNSWQFCYATIIFVAT